MKKLILTSFLVLITGWLTLMAQMRQMHLDLVNDDNLIKDIKFLNPAQGFIACTETSGCWVGYSSDSGRTYSKRYITLNNVDFGNFTVSTTFGFYLEGIVPFNQDILLAYGTYAGVHSILRSINGGLTYTLIFHSIPNSGQPGLIEDMVFPQNGIVGYAVDGDRILKTTNQGLTWFISRYDPGSNFDVIEAVDNNTVYVMSRDFVTNKLLRTTNAGSSWQLVTLPTLPGGKALYAYFLTANTGWLSMYDDVNSFYFYKTTNGGVTWTLLNNIVATPFIARRMKFTDENTGYAFSEELNTVYKTLNGGVIWEPLPRDNNFSYYNFSHDVLQVLSPTQLWAGGYRAFLEMTTNGGGVPIPQSYFRIDTTGVSATNTVNLYNFSRTGYTYKWLVNGAEISTAYNASYQHNINRTFDTIKLVVSNGTTTDTTEKYQYFPPPVIVSSFTPTVGATGSNITITGLSFTGATSVSFGGIPATGFVVISPTTITATVGSGSSGPIRVVTPTGQSSLGGFTYLQPPNLTSFTPASAATGTLVTINGANLLGTTSVKFGAIAATSFTVVSSSVITATTPSGPSGNVSVTTPAGTASLPNFISLPNIGSFTPNQGTEGTILTITGTSLAGTTGVTIGGINALSFTVISPDSIRAVVGVGASGSVAISKPGGNASLQGFTWYAPPSISSFSPVKGPVGTVVTISGTNFHPVADSNTVYFGTVKAVVTAGTTSSLTVVAPMGTTYKPISVTSNKLIGYSSLPYLLTFPNGGSITTASFADTTILQTPTGTTSREMCLADMDNDGKLDILLNTYTGVLIYRNQSTGNIISFAAPINLTGGSGTLATADLDGDGKLDIILKVLELYRNTSTPGNLSFATVVSLPDIYIPTELNVADLDGDGKVDIFGSNPTTGTKVYRNTSNPGVFSFEAPVSVSQTITSQKILAADLNNDGKPELLMGSSILKNNSTKRNFSFEPPVQISPNTYSLTICGDMDGDGKSDIVSSDRTSSKVILNRNTGTSGNLSFGPNVELHAMQYPIDLALGDLDGDGKNDIAVALDSLTIGVFKNSSTIGNLSFLPMVDYKLINNGFIAHLAGGDLNNDGKNDLTFSTYNQAQITIRRNDVKPEPIIYSFSPTRGISGTTITITGENFSGTTSVKFGGVPAVSFIVNSPTSITATLGTGASGSVNVTTTVGTASRRGFAYGIAPVITSISSTTAAAGSTLVITGTGFNATAANNFVYFGGTRAAVTAASSTSLSVTVPTGSLYGSISVVNAASGLTAYSSRYFSLTFPGANSHFTQYNFAEPSEFNGNYKGKLADIDGDGRLDLLFAANTEGFKVIRNTSVSPTISYAAPVITSINRDVVGLSTSDLDGDGKMDVVTINNGSASIGIFRNTSVSSSVSFGTAQIISLGYSSSGLKDIFINDMDLDGRPDILVANNFGNGIIAIFLNTSTPGTISFAPRIDFGIFGVTNKLAVQDLDADGKPELIANMPQQGKVVIFKNISFPGTVALNTGILYDFGNSPNGLKTGDIDGDGAMDFSLQTGNFPMAVSLFRNTTSNGVISFSPRIDYSALDGYSEVSMGDLDGDGKPDLIRAIYKTVSVFKNSSSAGSASMFPQVNYMVQENSYDPSIGDMDGDGIPDVVAYTAMNKFYVLRNMTGSTYVVSICPGTGSTLIAVNRGTSYRWQQNTGSGFVDVSNSANLSGVTTDTLQLTNVPNSWNNYEFRCVVNGTPSSQIIKIRILPVLTPSVLIYSNPAIGCVGNAQIYLPTATNGGTSPEYMWKLNGVHLIGGNSLLMLSPFSHGSIITAEMTSNANCLSTPTAISNALIANTVSGEPSVTISGNTTIVPGQAANITSAVINVGIPTYKWEDSTSSNGWQTLSGATNSTINYTPTQAGVKLRCRVTTNHLCGGPGFALSNVIVFVVGFPTAVGSTPASEYRIRSYPSPAREWLYIDSLKLADRWNTLRIIDQEGRTMIPDMNVINRTNISIPVSRLAAGIYFFTLRGRNNKLIYGRFVKQ